MDSLQWNPVNGSETCQQPGQLRDRCLAGRVPLQPGLLSPLDPMRAEPEDGTSIFGTVFGFLVFFVLLLLCVQAMFHLYVTSLVTAAATQAATAVARSGGDPTAEPAAQDAAVAELGGWGRDHTHFRWVEVDAELVRLQVIAYSGAMLPLPGLSRRIERTVTVPTQVFRGAP